LLEYNSDALAKCLKEDVLPFYRAMAQSGVESAVETTKNGSPGLPNSFSGGSSVTGVATPPSRADKARRMAQSITTGR